MGLRTIDFSAGQITDGTAGGGTGDNVLVADGLSIAITASGNWTANFAGDRFNFAEDADFGSSQFTIVITNADGRQFNFKDILFSANLSPVVADGWGSNVNIGGLLVPDDGIHGTGAAWTYSYLFPTGPLPVAGQSLTITDVPAYSATTPNPNPNPTTQIWFDDLIIDSRPGISSIVRTGSAEPTNVDSVTYTVTFSDPVSGVGIDDFTLSTTGGVTGTISGISGSGSTYTVTVDNITGTGTAKLNVKGSGTDIVDAGGSELPGGFTSGEAYSIDNSPPAAPASLDIDTDSITNNTKPTVTGTAEAGSTVELFDTDGTTLLGSTTADGSGDWSITTSALGDGVHDLSAKATDVVGNVSASSSQLQITIDTDAPSVTSITRAGSLSETNADSVAYTVTFSEDVSGVDIGDFSVAGTDTASGVISSVSGDGSQYTIVVDGIAGDGTMTLDLDSSNAGIIDTAGNLLAGDFSGGQFYTIDNIAPGAPSALDLDAASDTNIDADNITNNTTPTVTGTAEAGSTVELFDSNGTTLLGSATANGLGNWLIAASALGDGVHDLSAKTMDAAGNVSASSSPLQITIDTNGPSVTSITHAGGASASNADSVTYTVTFSEDVTGVGIGDFSVAPTDTASGTISSVSGDGSQYTIVVDAIAGDGTIVLNLNSSGTDIIDLAGNPSGAGYTAGQAYSVDNTAPTAANDTIAATANGTSSANVLGNDTGATAVLAVNGDPAVLGQTASGSNGGSFTVAANGDVDFNPGTDFAALTSTATELTSIDITVTDDAGNSAVSTLSVTVTGVNDAPLLAVNTGASVEQNATLVLRSSQLSTTDVDDTADGLIYSVTTLPVAGAIFLSGTALAIGGSFSQADIDAGRITYRAGASAGSQSFGFSVGDGGEDGAQALTGQTFTFTVSQATGGPGGNPGPGTSTPTEQTEVIDGIPVTTVTQTNSDGTTTETITVPVITDPGADAVDIPISKDENGNSVIEMHVPNGAGLTVSGSASSKPAGTSTADLIREITEHSSGGTSQDALTEGAAAFIESLPDDQELIIRTIVATVPEGGTLNGPLVFTGTPSTPGSPITALVIDTRGLPPGTLIELHDVEFATIIGDVHVTGGEGSQNVWGDGASQFIVLGADDDVLHGGAGDDTVGSAGGNDHIYGDDGNDTLFGGAGDDFISGGAGDDKATYNDSFAQVQVSFHNGQFTVGGAEGTDIIETVEHVEFTDGTVAFGTVDMDGIAGQAYRIYQTTFERFADDAGLDYWINELATGRGDLAWVTKNFMLSDEFRATYGEPDSLSNEAFLTLLYQNTLHRTPDEAGFTYWMDELANGFARENLVASFSESHENITNIGLSNDQPLWYL